MLLSVEMITVDSLDPERLAAWWARVLRGQVTVVIPGEFILVEHAGGPRLGFQHVHDPTPGKNRIHIDLAAGDLETEVERLVSLGAVETAQHRFGADFRWIVLTDPDGNAFCVGAAQE